MRNSNKKSVNNMSLHTFGYAVILIIIALVGLYIVMKLTNSDTSQTSPTQYDTVETNAPQPTTPPQIIYQQPQQQYQIPTPQTPEPPLRCKTEYFMGSSEVVCKKSWF